MISASADLDGLQRRLLDAARRLGEAQARMMAQRANPARWRSARLLWPLSSQE